MYILLLGLSIFFGIHLVPGLVGFRRRIITKLGEGTYQGLYSVISIDRAHSNSLWKVKSGI